MMFTNIVQAIQELRKIAKAIPKITPSDEGDSYVLEYGYVPLHLAKEFVEACMALGEERWKSVSAERDRLLNQNDRLAQELTDFKAEHLERERYWHDKYGRLTTAMRRWLEEA